VENEYNDFIKEYGNVLVTFSYYYKYSFHFSGVLDNGNEIIVSKGQNSDEIYKLLVLNNQTQTIKELNIDYASIKCPETRETLQSFLFV